MEHDGAERGEHRRRLAEERQEHAFRDAGADVLERERRGRDELAHDLEARVPAPHIVGEAGEGDREDADDDRDRHRTEFAARAVDHHEAEGDRREHAKEDGESAEVGDRILVFLPRLVRPIDDVHRDREPAHERRRDERDDEADDEDADVAVQQLAERVDMRLGRLQRNDRVDRRPDRGRHLRDGRGVEAAHRPAPVAASCAGRLPISAARSRIVSTNEIRGSKPTAARMRVRSGWRTRRSSKPAENAFS